MEVEAIVEEARAEKARKQDGANPSDAALVGEGPVDAFKGVTTEKLGEGIKDYWFAKLTPEQKDAIVDYMLGVIAANTKMFELKENGGDNDDYFKLITALAVSGAPHAEDYFVEFASKVDGADEEVLREKFRTCKKNANANKSQADGLAKVDVGFLIARARLAGADLSRQALAAQGLLGHPAVKFRDFTPKGKPCPSLANAVLAIKALGINVRLNLFRTDHHRTRWTYQWSARALDR